jgi:LacI family transcriptional regulator
LEDLARDLNVSVMTVSKVARGCPDVGRATRSRVLARIKELNYQPDWIARSLALRRTFMIGLVLPDLTDTASAQIAKAVAATVRPVRYDVVICASSAGAGVEASEVGHLLARQVDGLILTSAHSLESNAAFELIEARNVPYVLIDCPCTGGHAPYVGSKTMRSADLLLPFDRVRLPAYSPYR